MSKMIRIKRQSKGNKIRVNITVDKELLTKAKTKLNLFGGKISTLFNAYLADFIESMEKDFSHTHKEIQGKMREMERRLKKLEEQQE